MTAIFTAFGLAGAAGLNAYIPLMTVAVLGRLGVIHLASPYDEITKTWALVVIGLFLLVEIAVDKIPGVDHVNDIVQSFVRPAAGAVLFAASTGAIESMPAWLSVACGLLVALSVHATKAAARPAVNVSTLGVGAPVVSVIEDVVSTVTSVTAVLLPYLVLLCLLAMVVGLVWLWRKKRIRSRVP